MFWEVDPLLVDQSICDLHLQPSSPAIDRVYGGSIITDIDGDKRPIGLVDLGADEFGTKIYLPLISQ